MPDGADARKTAPLPGGLQSVVPVPATAWLEVGQGEHAASKDATLQMTATLGSCVAVILHNFFGRVGGMTHIFQCVDPGPAGSGAVVAEIEKLVNLLMQEGSPRFALEACVIGGARTLGRGRNVGGEIGLACLNYLDAERILLRTSDLGGTRARRITFRPVSGSLRIDYPGDAAPPCCIPPSRFSGGDAEIF